MRYLKLLFIALIIEQGAFAQYANGEAAQPKRYKIGVIDLMLLKRQKLGAIPLAKEVGADGVEIDMGGLGDRPTFDNQLATPEVREQFLRTARDLGLEISSLAMTGFYAQSFPTREGVENMVQDCINTMKLMGAKMAFLPLGVEGDLVQHPERRAAIVERLRNIGKRSEDAGIIVAVETALDARGEVELLKEIGSPAIKVCFNFSNPLAAGRDLYEELEILGKDRIGKIHCTNKDGVWLQNDPEIDMRKVKETLDRMGWSGWLLVERSRDANNPRDVRGNYGANVKYMKSIFDEYWQVVTQRAGKIVETLHISDPQKSERVRDLIARQYYDLNGIHDRCKAEKEKLKEKAGTGEEIEAETKALQAKADSQLAVLHRKYITNLSSELTPEQIEGVKNGMTYGVLTITYAGYLDMIPELTGEEKQQIMTWLTEAREHAMDAGSSEEKHGWFGKYKGRINNYLSSHGYDLKKYSKAREARIRESKLN